MHPEKYPDKIQWKKEEDIIYYKNDYNKSEK